MKHLKQFLSDARRHKGLALIIVLSMLALATIVILAFLSVADTEHKATLTFSRAQSARRMADTAVNMVIAQIRAGAEQDVTVNGREIHATQPGAIRKYTQEGAFLAGYKLFSDANLIYRNEGIQANASSAVPNQMEYNFVAESEPPADWNKDNNLSRYVDLNEPVIKGSVGAGGTVNQLLTFFPIIDPRAGQDMDPAPGADIPIEGFSYAPTTALKGNNLSENNTLVKTPASTKADLSDLRLAMPVQWMYVLKDGTVGYLTDALKFISSTPAGPVNAVGARRGVPSAANPIVGRIAFWTDDETCKVNINTASDPTFMGQPLYYHERDHRWADYPPTRSEYQRFPGHPATVALSSIFYPNPFQDETRSLDPYRKTGPDLTRILSVKNRIYKLAPKIEEGGSEGGTKFFDTDSYSATLGSKASEVAISGALNERLYASVDELIFSAESSGNERQRNILDISSGVLFNKQTLERASAFLTAHSRASEISMWGLPRIAMWPIDTRDNRRTGFDRLLAFCSTINGKEYYFKREKPRNSDFDIEIPRNKNLMLMLDNIVMNQVHPPHSETGGVGRTFVDKLGRDNARQILVEMFDYIRSTNLYDGFLVKQDRNTWETFVGGPDWYQTYLRRDILEQNNAFLTYTPGIGRNPSLSLNGAGNPYKDDPFQDRFFPGHGQVTPSKWRVPGAGKTYMGFGRSVSISEIGIHFICTADGQPDMYSWRIPKLAADQPSDSAEGVNYEIPVVADEALEAEMAKANDSSVSDADKIFISGGRTALKIKEDVSEDWVVVHSKPVGFNGTARIVNEDAVHWRNDVSDNDKGSIKERYYSNFPPLTSMTPGKYGTNSGSPDPKNANYARSAAYHPGYDYRNWNWTLDRNTPLDTTKKRLQAVLHLEFFCPGVGYTGINPEYTIVLKGDTVSSIEVTHSGGKSEALFSTTSDVVLKSYSSLFEADSTPMVGGFASFRKVANGRRLPARGNMPADNGHVPDASGTVHDGSINLDLVSGFFDVERNSAMQFTSGELEISVYDTHDYQNNEPVQTIKVRLDGGRAPTPDIVVAPTAWVNYTTASGGIYNHPPVQAPRWWSFHRDGCLGRYDENGGRIDPDTAASFASTRGRFYRFDTNSIAVSSEMGTTSGKLLGKLEKQQLPGARAVVYAKDANYKDVQIVTEDVAASDPYAKIRYGSLSDGDPKYDYNMPLHFGSDTLRTLQPRYGDARLIAGKAQVESSDWARHRFWNNPNAHMAHNFSSYSSSGDPGFDFGVEPGTPGVDVNARVLPPDVTAGSTRHPDAPHTQETAAKAQRYYDFDDSDPGGRSGPFINKPDEGNYAVGDVKLANWPQKMRYRFSYFRPDGNFGAFFAAGGGSHFSPNRMISSPILMGSLPSRLWDANGEGAWTNLLFRPHLAYSSGITKGVGSAPTHPGEATPPDHYLLDMFWMPVVEPYAISEGLSTAGKINMNYQMLPFTHIRRATALHAAMKGEMFAALPNKDYDASRSIKTTWTTTGGTAPVYRDEANENRYWHRSIVIDRFKPKSGSDTPWWTIQNPDDRVKGTLLQFERRFNFGKNDSRSPFRSGEMGRGGLFRTPSQLSELHLIPTDVQVGQNVDRDAITQHHEALKNEMANFWSYHASTGDNTRERPYSNLYAKLTTRSNTFRVHVRAQTISKASRSVEADVFDPATDKVTAEYRGSFLIERYIDPSSNLPDYADGTNPMTKDPLDSYYRFRVLESKRFAP